MLIQIENLSKSFGQHLVFQNVSAELYSGRRYGLIGANGAGKSTLLSIIAGELEPDEGRVMKPKGTRIGFLKQDSGLSLSGNIESEMKKAYAPLMEIKAKMDDLSAKIAAALDGEERLLLSDEYSKLQNYYEINDGYNFDYKIEKVLNGMGFEGRDRATSIISLSGGEKTRLGLAKLLLESPDLLILDEPTNHLDFATLMWLEEYLGSYPGIILLVSHDRYFLEKTVDNILEMSMHKLEEYKGKYSRYLSQKEERSTLRWKEYETQQEEIEKLEDYVRRNITRASTSAMAKGRRKILERMVRLEKPSEHKTKVSFRFALANEPYKALLSVVDLAVGFKSNAGDMLLAKNINLSMERGEKIGIVGKNGVGKSTFLKTILGLIPQLSGKYKWGENAKIGYYEQETLDLDPHKTAINELWDRFPALNEQEIRARLGSVGLTGENVFKSVASISGGEKAKLKFAILSFKPCNVLILDEPTNHLDLNSKEILEEALSNYEGAIIFVSHDRFFLSQIPEKIVEISENGAQIYDGNYEVYLAEQAKYKEKEEKPAEKKPVINQSFRSKDDRRKEAEQKAKLRKLEEEITALEAEKEEILLAMQEESVFTDFKRLEEKTKRLHEIEGLYEEKLIKWEEAMI